MRIVSLLSILLILSFSNLSHAQAIKFTKDHEHQLAINATNFIQTLVSFNGSTFNNTPYDFQYKYLNWQNEGKYALGFRAGYGFSKTTFDQEQPNSNTESKSKQTFLDTRLGFEFQYALSTRWNFFAGIDFIYSKAMLNGSSSFRDFNNQVVISETDDYSERFGYGPVMGIQFNISKRLALGTELSLYTINNRTWRKSSVSNSPNFNQFLYIESSSSAVQVPSFIYFIVRL